MSLATIKKDRGLPGIIERYIPKIVEDPKDISVSFDWNASSPYFQAYELFLKSDVPYTPTQQDVFEYFSSHDFPTLRPDCITALVQSLSCYGTEEKHKILLPRFISGMIQQSYDAGYNDFRIVLDTRGEFEEIEWGELCGLHGKPENRLRLLCEGDLPMRFGAYFQYIDATILGSCFSAKLGLKSTYSRFKVTDECLVFPGDGAFRSEFCINKVIEMVFRYWNKEPEECTYILTKEEDVPRLIKSFRRGTERANGKDNEMRIGNNKIIVRRPEEQKQGMVQ